jgi:hypothetical protein
MLAASGAEDCKHGAQDPLACSAEQRAAHRWRQHRGSFSGRRWRFVARLAGKYPRMAEFQNAILHPHAQNLVPPTLRHAHLCSPFSSGSADRCCSCVVPAYRQSCGKLHAPVALGSGRRYLTDMQSGFETQSIVTVQVFTQALA